MPFTIDHSLVSLPLTVVVVREAERFVIRCAASGTLIPRHPGELSVRARATYTLRVTVEPEPGPDGAPIPRHPASVIRTVPLKVTVRMPNGVPVTAGEITLGDLKRFRDPRGIAHGDWTFEVRGETFEPADELGEVLVRAGTGSLGIDVVEHITSKSAAPLVDDDYEARLGHSFKFDLYRVGRLHAEIGTHPLLTVDRRMTLVDPDGLVVATGDNGRLTHDIELPTLARSRDIRRVPRLWTLNVLPSPGLNRSGRLHVKATVTQSAQITVAALQDRIDLLLGVDGKNLEIFGQMVDGEMLARLRIRELITAETIDRFNLLNHTIESVGQDEDVDKDIRVGVTYTLFRRSSSLKHGISVALKNLRVGRLSVSVGASQKIQPSVPALRFSVEIKGEVKLEFKGIPLGSIKVRGQVIEMELGLQLQSDGSFGPRSFINEKLLDVDISVEAALAAGLVLGAVAALGIIALVEELESLVNTFIVDSLANILAGFAKSVPPTLAMLLGDDFTYRALRTDGDDIVFDYDAPLEPEPRPTDGYSGIIGRSATQIGPGVFRFQPSSLGDTWAAPNLAKIDHIVVVTMENRSYDHVLGYLAERDADSDGLTPELLSALEESLPKPVPRLGDLETIPPNALGKRTAFPRKVSHNFEDVTQQLSFRSTVAGRVINSPRGFVDNFSPKKGELDAEDVLGFYDGEDLPFYDYLAQNFARCERFFCSHPGPTLPNRMFLLSGDLRFDRTGAPVLNNNDGDFAFSRATTVFDVLTREGVSWRVYESFPSVTPLRMFARYATDVTNIVPVSQFAADVAAGTLPSVTMVEPAMNHDPQDDDHPTADMYRGQEFVQGIYDALRANDGLWRRTLLILTYDEHGGFYDHVLTPLAESRARPQSVSAAIGPAIGPAVGGGIGAGPGAVIDSGTGTRGSDGPAIAPIFVSTPYGVRVPTFVVSPWTPPGKGPDIVLDHCSIAKTILARFLGAKQPFLSDRVHASRSLDAYLSLDAPRLDVPILPPLTHLSSSARLAGKINTLPVSRQELLSGDVDSHDLLGMVARILNRPALTGSELLELQTHGPNGGVIDGGTGGGASDGVTGGGATHGEPPDVALPEGGGALSGHEIDLSLPPYSVAPDDPTRGAANAAAIQQAILDWTGRCVALVLPSGLIYLDKLGTHSSILFGPGTSDLVLAGRGLFATRLVQEGVGTGQDWSCIVIDRAARIGLRDFGVMQGTIQIPSGGQHDHLILVQNSGAAESDRCEQIWGSNLFLGKSLGDGLAFIGDTRPVRGCSFDQLRIDGRGFVQQVWQASTAYAVGAQVRNGAHAYLCTVGGVSGSGGPVGDGADIPDGSCHWSGAARDVTLRFASRSGISFQRGYDNIRISNFDIRGVQNSCIDMEATGSGTLRSAHIGPGLCDNAGGASAVAVSFSGSKSLTDPTVYSQLVDVEIRDGTLQIAETREARVSNVRVIAERRLPDNPSTALCSLIRNNSGLELHNLQLFRVGSSEAGDCLNIQGSGDVKVDGGVLEQATAGVPISVEPGEGGLRELAVVGDPRVVVRGSGLATRDAVSVLARNGGVDRIRVDGLRVEAVGAALRALLSVSTRGVFGAPNIQVSRCVAGQGSVAIGLYLSQQPGSVMDGRPLVQACDFGGARALRVVDQNDNPIGGIFAIIAGNRDAACTLTGAVEPAGAVVAPPGTSYLRADTNAAQLFLKVSGVGAEGWAPVLTGPASVASALLPGDAASWAALIAQRDLNIAPPAGSWVFQDASGDANPSIGSLPLVAGGAVRYHERSQGTAGFLVGIPDNGANTGFSTTSSALPDPSSTSYLLLVLGRLVATPAAPRSLFFINGSSGEVRVQSTGKARIFLGGNDVQTAHPIGGGMHLFALRLNETANTALFATELEKVEPSYVARATGARRVGLGGFDANSAPFQARAAYLWTGPAAEISNGTLKALMRALGFEVVW